MQLYVHFLQAFYVPGTEQSHILLTPASCLVEGKNHHPREVLPLAHGMMPVGTQTGTVINSLLYPQSLA